jgi:CHASE2 domain-containing sensor protein
VGKLVVLRMGEGSFETGFPVTVQIGEEADRPSVETQGKLPPNPAITKHYENWQVTYRNLGLRSRLQAPAGQITNVSIIQDCYNAAQQLQHALNTWLQADSFRPVRERLLEKLLPSEEIRFILQMELPQLQRLPWHSWELLDRYPKAELAISAPVYERISHPTSIASKIRILAILGNSQGIDIQADRDLLANLPDAEVTFLVEPDRKALTDKLWEQPWDIFFFAGHSTSQTDGSGQMHLNPTDSLTIRQLKFALKRAVEQGLKLAIFNSCDGLGLARELADLQIPEVIVMREPVPDRVAQEFLKYFLSAFAQGNSFYLAVRIARERLQALEDQFPCATWLPIICQNPAVSPPTWQDLLPIESLPFPTHAVERSRRSSPRPPSRIYPLLTALLIAASMLGIRHFGFLQPIELKAFDQMMQLRPKEQPDPRLLVITITEDDIQMQRQNGENLRGTSLSDQSLSRLLAVLEKHQPRVIGLDLYRDFPVDPKHPELTTRLRQTPNLIGICKASDIESETRGIDSPVEIPVGRLGFSDFIHDDDGVLRRHLLFMTPEPVSQCQADYAFSVLLSFQYLAVEKITPTFTENQDLKLGETVFKRLQPHTAGYQRIDTGGSQIMVNYRTAKRAAYSITLEDALNKPIAPEAVKDKIVLIGVTAKSADDYWHTSYHRSSEPVPGVFVQADMTSQILSAVLDRRPLVWTWHPFAELTWVLLWSLLGGMMVWWQRSLPRFVLTLGITIVLLYSLCLSLLLRSGWVPFIPAALTLTTTSSIIFCRRKLIVNRQQLADQ